ncbi:MAG TPA: 3-dehydroquinate synthase [Candidatus Sphingobacterium stercoripullorum]|uniref:3-dehydroquinate synthase n=1 Tax=Candidatus Sphingobacterium stercoripullorum TaxID=2838759 RepID=A0A9D2AZS7_9SPHI|nr:3-dehydroquinate synthase [Candidatus Sphingobacterium stercoripullorum]
MHVIESLGYQVVFDRSLSSLVKFIEDRSYSQVLILVDSNTVDYCLPLLEEAIDNRIDYDVIEIEAGEENKTIETCQEVWKAMIEFGVDRNSLLLNLGGGVVTDLGGFVASTYKRGVDFIQIPTTLLSQVDASVGGKTGVDLGNLKNIIGTFTQPQAVVISGEFLNTLDKRQVISGLAEVIKHGLISDKALFLELQKCDLFNLTDQVLFRSVELKNEVVLVDPHEKGKRKTLNFGHTIGHAVEGYSLMHDKDSLLHGEAIAIGMICEAYLSFKYNGLKEEELKSISAFILKTFPNRPIPENGLQEMLSLMKNDKKNTGEKISFSLLREIGACDWDLFLEESVIIDSMRYYNSLIK